jgi:hypothetical protein
MSLPLILEIILLILAVIWWAWFAQKLNGIHAETKRAADALEAMNTRELRADAKARAAESARLSAQAEPESTAEIDAEAARIREETRRRAGL